jgi:hypothetical protein
MAYFIIWVAWRYSGQRLRGHGPGRRRRHHTQQFLSHKVAPRGLRRSFEGLALENSFTLPILARRAELGVFFRSNGIVRFAASVAFEVWRLRRDFSVGESRRATTQSWRVAHLASSSAQLRGEHLFDQPARHHGQLSSPQTFGRL